MNVCYAYFPRGSVLHVSRQTCRQTFVYGDGPKLGPASILREKVSAVALTVKDMTEEDLAVGYAVTRVDITVVECSCQ